MSTLSGLDNSKKYKAKIKLLNGRTINVHSTTDSPDSSYGIQCWVDSKGKSYGQITYNHPAQHIFDICELVTFAEALKEAGLTLAEFCRQTGTPRRTAEKWAYGLRRTPELAFAWLTLYKSVNQ